MNYVLDTNVVLGILRGTEEDVSYCQSHGLFTNLDSVAIISIVTLGELLAFSMKNNWGVKRINELEELVKGFVIVPIESRDLVEMYAEIDAFSQNRLQNKGKSHGQTARNMGKNDLWIAATTTLASATLVTHDHDFDHLAGEYLQIDNP